MVELKSRKFNAISKMFVGILPIGHSIHLKMSIIFDHSANKWNRFTCYGRFVSVCEIVLHLILFEAKLYSK